MSPPVAVGKVVVRTTLERLLRIAKAEFLVLLTAMVPMVAMVPTEDEAVAMVPMVAAVAMVMPTTPSISPL